MPCSPQVKLPSGLLHHFCNIIDYIPSAVPFTLVTSTITVVSISLFVSIDIFFMYLGAHCWVYRHLQLLYLLVRLVSLPLHNDFVSC